MEVKSLGCTSMTYQWVNKGKKTHWLLSSLEASSAVSWAVPSLSLPPSCQVHKRSVICWWVLPNGGSTLVEYSQLVHRTGAWSSPKMATTKSLVRKFSSPRGTPCELPGTRDNREHQGGGSLGLLGVLAVSFSLTENQKPCCEDDQVNESCEKKSRCQLCSG